jgi:hypothetical protein
MIKSKIIIIVVVVAFFLAREREQPGIKRTEATGAKQSFRAYFAPFFGYAPFF